MKITLLLIMSVLIGISCTKPVSPTGLEMVRSKKAGLNDYDNLTPSSPALTLLIRVEHIGIHPGSSIGIISQIRAEILQILDGAPPSAKLITFSIATDHAKLYEIGQEYILTKGYGHSAADQAIRLRKPDKVHYDE